MVDTNGLPVDLALTPVKRLIIGCALFSPAPRFPKIDEVMDRAWPWSSSFLPTTLCS